MAGSEEDTTGSLVDADDMAGGGGRQDTVLADEELLDTVGGTNLGNQLDDLGVPVTAVTANDEEGSWRGAVLAWRRSWRVEHYICLPSTPSGMERRMLVTKASL